MNPILKNVLAVIIGWVGGSVINIALVHTVNIVYPIAGIDPSDMDALVEILPTLDYNYFIFPFLAHAIGTLVGALIAGLIAPKNKMKFSLVVGVLFLIGGILVNYILPGPTWFTILDLVVAYLPMAWIGGKLAQKLSKSTPKGALNES